jgi:dephospho-CoA kinase
VIDNDGTLDALRHQVARLHAQYQTMASELED